MILRPMTMADADKMLEWKNYPETRQFAIATHDEIKKEEHYKWLADNLQYFHLIEFDLEKDRAGAIRIQDNEISIWIDRKYWGSGLATFVLDKESHKGMEAKIVEGNIPSMRAFINAGFKPVSYQDNYYIFQR